MNQDEIPLYDIGGKPIPGSEGLGKTFPTEFEEIRPLNPLLPLIVGLIIGLFLSPVIVWFYNYLL